MYKTLGGTFKSCPKCRKTEQVDLDWRICNTNFLQMYKMDHKFHQLEACCLSCRIELKQKFAMQKPHLYLYRKFTVDREPENWPAAASRSAWRGGGTARGRRGWRWSSNGRIWRWRRGIMRSRDRHNRKRRRWRRIFTTTMAEEEATLEGSGEATTMSHRNTMIISFDFWKRVSFIVVRRTTGHNLKEE